VTVQEPIKNHFNPVFYLKAWSRDGKVVRYYRPHGPVVATPISPKNTGFDNDLYAFEGVPADKRQLLEKEFFSPVDSKAAVVHRLLLDGKLDALTGQQRIDWARFMMSMQHRNPFSLDEIKRLAEQNLRANLAVEGDADYLATRAPGDPDTLYDWTALYQPQVLENAHKQFLPGLIDHENLGNHLINMLWSTIGLSTAEFSLLTGDRPVISTHGWKDPNVILALPLSPKCLFVATNTRLRTLNPTTLVKDVNDQIVRCAVDFVIGTDASHLRFVERRLRFPHDEPVPGAVGRGRPDCPV
jgi:hypothetical protein